MASAASLSSGTERGGGEMPLYLLIPMFAGVALFGWVAGMWTHKRAEHWCMACGALLDCGRCQRRDSSVDATSPAARS
jgi:hypothetical protein